MSKVLLHICCGVCAFWSIERLKQKGYEVEGYFYNPNIQPEPEYQKRKTAIITVSQNSGIIIHQAEYETKAWSKSCQKFPDEPEGGIRCLICYQLRLSKTFQFAAANGFDLFTTTLTISPYKKSSDIFKIGKEIGADMFLEEDFKKQDGFKKTSQLAKEHQLYRQDYCGCLYSKKSKLVTDTKL